MFIYAYFFSPELFENKFQAHCSLPQLTSLSCLFFMFFWTIDPLKLLQCSYQNQKINTNIILLSNLQTLFQFLLVDLKCSFRKKKNSDSGSNLGSLTAFISHVSSVFFNLEEYSSLSLSLSTLTCLTDVCVHSISQSCPTLCNLIRLLSPRDSPDNTTGVSSNSFLQGVFPTQGSNLGLLHCRQILLNSLPFLLQGDLPDPGMELASCIGRRIFYHYTTWEAINFTVILYFEFVWCFLMIRFRLCIFISNFTVMSFCPIYWWNYLWWLS